ncbi:translesion DNA synthesis-associated protein ImuA [Uliginosibacterium sp. TH139]|uniref:translesion DNA synthesis-associated protein ImuA n=1 Tax=Uliginosibacterium sp. TH139 TaxID=2067453 RepID=UPI000C7C235C|nr:translesion DNA synthesis-associated protein ImuA [Uliginosibacterium sp. TH139]PLK48495.1 SOS cell division inhibitor [Uliginosibacterium sp. TH139]
MSMPVPLDEVLLRPDVWRGDRFAPNEAGEVASGFAALDAELPGGGWPRGALTELLPAQRGIGELALLQPALRSCAEDAPVALVAPPWLPHAPAWAAALPLERLLLVEASGREAAWAAEALLASGALGALLLWLPAQVDARSLRRLQLAAEGHRAPAFVFRPPALARTASPAPLRLTLSAAPQGLQIDLLKRRGPPCTKPLLLSVPRPVAPRPVPQAEPISLRPQRVRV